MKRSRQITGDVGVLGAAYLDELVRLGYGKTWEDVVSYLLQRSLDDLLRAGVLTRPKERKP